MTAAQSSFAVVLLAGLFLTPRSAIVLFALFITQLVLPFESVRFAFSGVYLILVALLLAFNGSRRRSVFSLPYRAYQEGFVVRGRGEDDGRASANP